MQMFLLGVEGEEGIEQACAIHPSLYRSTYNLLEGIDNLCAQMEWEDLCGVDRKNVSD